VNEAFFATLTGIMGIALGRLWDARSESSRWRRDLRTSSYQSLAEAFMLLYEDVRSVALAKPGTRASAEAVQRARRDKTWDNALVGVWLHGSTAVASAASEIDAGMTELFYATQGRRYSTDDWNRARIRSADAFEKFMTVARKDIGLSAVPSKVFPYALSASTATRPMT
jgi:hypothetical protein